MLAATSAGPGPPGLGGLAITLRPLAIVLVLAVLAAPLAAGAQAGRKIPRIGVLAVGGPDAGPSTIVGLRQGLRELGYVEGQTFALEVRSADGVPERLPGFAAELVRLKVDVLVASSNLPISAAHIATTSIPIVMTNATDPVGSGFVATLARPGGNVTGLTIQSPDVISKPLQLLTEAVPGLSKVAVIWDPGLPGARQSLSKVEAAARALDVQLQLVEMRSRGDLEGALDAVIRERARAAFIFGSPMQFAERERIAELAVNRRLPTTCPLREFAEAGCLIGYGASLTDQHRRAAYFVDRILKGVKPADLPIEQPTKFYFAINLKTAKALGLTIPPSLLQRADQVIE
jgi:ABC-type uncharacterized transport system substrate-binding protein